MGQWFYFCHRDSTLLHEKVQHGYNTLFLPIEYYSKDGLLLINSDIVLTGSG